MSLMQMSISGAIMILAIIAIRALAINRLPKKTFIALWGIVLLRLLVPFSFPSPFSAYSLVNQHVFTSGETVGLENANVIPTPPVDLPITGNAVMQEQSAASISPYAIAWGIGLIVCALFFTISYFKCHREFRESLPIKNAFLTQWIAEHKLSRPIEIRQSSRISAPLTYGIFKPIILMPKSTKWDDTKQIEYILAHEFVHIRRFDAATKLLLTAALCIHWFNPLVWAMYILSNRDIELSCDETVVRFFGETTKSTYALMLISMEEKKSSLTPLCNSFSKNAIEERITAIMKMKKTSFIATLVAVGLIVSVTTAFATSVKPLPTIPNTNLAQSGDDQLLDKESMEIIAAESGAQSSTIPPSLNASTTQTVTYSNVEMRRYEGADGHPYIHDTKVNETTKKIIGYKYGMLAFDKDGNPLKINWWTLDTDAESTYFNLDETSTEIAPAETYDVFGGWSLNYFGTDSSVEKIAYVLYCDKEITFEDGTIWTNPNFDGWRSTYEGKKIDVNVLKGYYPYVQTISFAK